MLVRILVVGGASSGQRLVGSRSTIVTQHLTSLSALPATTASLYTTSTTNGSTTPHTSSDAPAQSVSSLLAGYTFRMRQAVRWGDMDAFQHLNNVAYFRHVESARIAFGGWYSTRAQLPRFLSGSGIGPILSSTSCHYRSPVLYPDTLVVGVRIEHLNKDRGTFVERYCVVSEQQRKVVAELEAKIVVFNYDVGKRAPIPDALADVLEQLKHPDHSIIQVNE
jgi:acyl-CoA thioester hydrolase